MSGTASRLQGMGRDLPGPGRGPAGAHPAQGRHRRGRRRLPGGAHRFWLFPTYVHQQRDGDHPEALPLLEQVEAERPTGRA